MADWVFVAAGRTKLLVCLDERGLSGVCEDGNRDENATF